MVDFAYRNVLSHEQAVPPAEVCDVAHEHQRTGCLSLVQQRDAAYEHSDISQLKLLGRRDQPSERSWHRGVLEAQLGEAGAEDPAVGTEAVKSVDGVGRGELDTGCSVQGHHPVAHTRCLARQRLVHGEREGACSDHPRQAVKDSYVNTLELAGAPPDDERGLACEHGDHFASEAHRDAYHPGQFAPRRNRHLSFDNALELPCPCQQWPLTVRYLAP